MNEEVAEARPLAFSAPVGSIRGVPVVEVHGEVDLATVPGLLEAIGRAGARLDGRPLAFVDLREAQFIDVAGVRHLVEEAQAMRELGAELRLVVPGEGPVARVFKLLEVGRTLELHYDLDLSTDGLASQDDEDGS